MRLLTDFFAQGRDRIMIEIQDEKTLTCVPSINCNTDSLADMIEAICQVGELTIRMHLEVKGILLLSKIQDFEVLTEDSFLPSTYIKAEIIGQYNRIYQCQMCVMFPKKHLIVKATYVSI